MKKLLYREETIPLPHYHYRVYVVLTDNIYEATCKIKKVENIKERSFYENAAALSLHMPDKGATYLLFTAKSDIGDVAHECWHAVRYLLCDHIDSDLENENVAYHLGYLVLHTWDVLKHLRKKKR